MYLTDEDIEKLTGTNQRAAQLRYLDEQDIPYRLNRKKEIVIARYWVERLPFEGKNDPKGGLLKVSNFGRG